MQKSQKYAIIVAISVKNIDVEFFMGKKHYFLNSIYLSICLSFVVVASFLNFNNSVAKQDLQQEPTNVEFHFQDEEDATDDNTSSDFNPLDKIDNKHKSEIAATYSTDKPAPVISYSQPSGISYSSYIIINGRTLRIQDVDDTLIDSTDHVNRWGKKFLYGHNTAGVFGSMANLSNGATFTVAMDGEEHTYQIAYMETMVKSKVEENMLGIAYASYGGSRYDLSLMTCAGRSTGGGDATHRLVVFANRIS